MTPDVVILGVNGNCIDIADAVARIDGLRLLGFLDDSDAVQGTTIVGAPVLGRIADAVKHANASFVCGIGSPKSYKHKPSIIARAGVPLDRWATIVHPTAVVSPHASIGPGTVLLAHASVGAFVKIGAHCMVLQGAIVSHDSVVGDYCALATGVRVSGSCVVGDNAYLGCGALLRDGVKIGAGALVGVGSVVVKDVRAGAIAYGNPAREKPHSV
jgi:sugar O-acyltransferase (sialic acid O-acetyltransferase NeuD family)